ncbi:hypothetical protein SPI_07740 [Niveomyces insectorum RCEF 264]|uniref:Uncharacterized protein n=1 Tax=Niveomyces insectorum RCEF 264 TaxID=1081102 RepID=A0A167PJU9_9HYPO|nr:hypothetical protein SPI_07740 [Niveomyces insectorum RCEF 264]
MPPAAAALGGIWVPSMYRNIKKYTTFAQLANRCPLALVKRGNAEGFKLAEVTGKTVLLKSGNGASLFLGDTGDYFFVDIVSARIMAQKNPGVSVAMKMATDGGNIPWSVYYWMHWVQQNDAETYREDLPRRPRRALSRRAR